MTFALASLAAIALLLAHGWSDPALSARSTLEYFKAVQRRTPQAASFSGCS